MIRSVVLIIGISCVAVVMSELLGAALLWSRGQLTAETIAEIRDVLGDRVAEDVSVDQAAESKLPSNDEVIRERALRILDLQGRQDELAQLKQLVTEQRDRVLQQLDEFDKKKREFDEQLAKQAERIASEATEQTQAILLALPPAEAVRNLMQLELEDNVILLKGMPEKSIAKILQEFVSAANAETEQRGLQVFEALSRGEPTQGLVRDAQQQPTTDRTGPTS